ncbi:MAG TPA: ribonuclease III, partial [Deltaproteobacteria bacterium]|nr:ribonuclease III [Deltaproteobacteria bacterium]
AALEERLGHRFSEPDLLEQALAHRSWSCDQRPIQPDNERLEFLGDAVLGLVVAEKLYRTFDDPEGRLTQARAAAIRKDALAAQARKLELGRWLLLGKGEEGTGGRDKDSILADALEAVIGALYLDGGLETADRFIGTQLGHDLVQRASDGGVRSPRDPRTTLQELLQGTGAPAPTYTLIDSQGPDHQPTWTIEVAHESRTLARGSGSSKQEAAREAAKKALAVLSAVSEPEREG